MNTDWSFAMHDCRETKEQITELLLDGADCRSDEVLSATLRGCADCRNEFEALNATLRITARSREISAPAESYWVDYHARLRQRIQHSANEFDAKAQRLKAEPTFFLAALRRCVRTTVPVPVPLMVAVVLAFAAIGLIAIRAAKQPELQSPSIVHVPVEVPVVQEKIVTRVVYRERRSPARTAKRTTEPKVESTFAKFKPTDEVKLIVIKGGSPYEK
jgi:hypothetical protein